MNHPTAARKTFCFDIDGVLATIVEGNQYDRAAPRKEAIEIVNALYESGHTIILFTARGYVTGIDWTDVTRRQMQAWGVRHHQLLFGKPAADFYIDDKAVPLEQLHHLKSYSNPL